ncbi:MAG: TetR/AcrR family transcriptional regulator [Pseudomonadota bacterium]|uniref:TetR/AcrR family transcriptional regulator n=1 Tax=Sphingomonas sp. ERG5 TaxID=1381597 RepID=UPI000A6F489B|nr:TetR/AcrR family transcriptional regulator [Sphingomonas sp. ERG5]
MPVREKRRKRHSDEARNEGLTAARELLLSEGPAAVTLARVGKMIGMSHTNVIHHFGSAAGLQTALMGSMIRDLAGALDEAVSQLRTDAAAPSILIDQVWTAFDEGGAGQLAAWLVLTREVDHLEPIRQAVLDLVSAVKEKYASEPSADDRIRSIVLLIAIAAFGDAVIGPHLRGMLDQDSDAGRKLMTRLLPVLVMG